MKVLRALGQAWRGHERRRHRRFEQPVLELHLAGGCHRTRNWSLGGFRLSAVPGRYRPGTRLEGTIVLPPGAGRAETGSFLAEVVRHEADGELHLRVLEIAPAVFVGLGVLAAM